MLDFETSGLIASGLIELLLTPVPFLIMIEIVRQMIIYTVN